MRARGRFDGLRRRLEARRRRRRRLDRGLEVGLYVIRDVNVLPAVTFANRDGSRTDVVRIHRRRVIFEMLSPSGVRKRLGGPVVHHVIIVLPAELLPTVARVRRRPSWRVEAPWRHCGRRNFGIQGDTQARTNSVGFLEIRAVRRYLGDRLLRAGPARARGPRPVPRRRLHVVALLAPQPEMPL